MLSTVSVGHDEISLVTTNKNNKSPELCFLTVLDDILRHCSSSMSAMKCTGVMAFLHDFADVSGSVCWLDMYDISGTPKCMFSQINHHYPDRVWPWRKGAHPARFFVVIKTWGGMRCGVGVGVGGVCEKDLINLPGIFLVHYLMP